MPWAIFHERAAFITSKSLFFRFGGKDAKVNICSTPKLAVTSPSLPDDSPEQTLKVKMPQGSTERSKKLIAKQKQAAATAAGKFENSLCFKAKIHI